MGLRFGRWKKRAITGFCLLVRCLSILSACSLFCPAWGQEGHPELKISVIPHRSHMGNEEAYRPVFEALEKHTGMAVRFIGSGSYEEAVRKLGEKTVDVAYLGPFAYVTAKRDFGARLIVRTLDGKRKEFYKSMIVTRKDSGISSLEQLKGKSFAFTDPRSTSGFLFPLVGLKKAGLSLEEFSRVEYVKRHANSLLAVYARQMDAGAVSSTARDKVRIDFDEIRVLWESEPIYRGPWVARGDMPEEMFRKIRTALLKIDDSENREEIFENLNTSGFVPGKDSDYDNVREALSVKIEIEKAR